MQDADPIVGCWYHRPEKAQKFQVVAVDETAETVEIQYFDGTVDEFELAVWPSLEAEPIEPPEDWTGPLDDVEKDDLTSAGTEMSREDWARPYREEDEKRRAGPAPPEDAPEAADDWGEGRPDEEPWKGED